jgi:hypothetical protein
LKCSPIPTSECACLPAHLFFCCLPTTILCSLIILRGKGGGGGGTGGGQSWTPSYALACKHCNLFKLDLWCLKNYIVGAWCIFCRVFFWPTPHLIWGWSMKFWTLLFVHQQV